MNTRYTSLAAAAFALLVSANAGAQTNVASTFNLQGRLTSTTGQAISDGSHTLIISVYANGSSTAAFTETDQVTTADGIFSVQVGKNAALNLNAKTNYSVGIAVDGQSQLQPLISVSAVPKADVAANASTSDSASVAASIGGFRVSTNGSSQPNTLVVLDQNGKLPNGLLDSSGVTSINGLHGNVSIQGGGNLNVSSVGNTLSLSFNAGGTGGLNFPFSQNLAIANSAAFTINNSLSGTTGSFINSGVGGALTATSGTGSALIASSTGTFNGAPTISASNTGGVAISAATGAATTAAIAVRSTATTAGSELFTATNGAGSLVANLTTTGLALSGNASAGSDAVLSLSNTATNATSAALINASANGNAVFSVASNGATSISSFGSTGLNVTESLATGTAGNAQASGGAAINAVNSSATAAALQVQNTAASGTAQLIAAKNASGSTVLGVQQNGSTTITSSAATALDASTTAVGGTAARFTGGLSLVGPVGTSAVTAGNLTAAVANPFVHANSIILVTVNSVLATAVPVRIAAQSEGSFTVALISVAALASNLGFNYLIINQ